MARSSLDALIDRFTADISAMIQAAALAEVERALYASLRQAPASTEPSPSLARPAALRPRAAQPAAPKTTRLAPPPTRGAPKPEPAKRATEPRPAPRPAPKPVAPSARPPLHLPQTELILRALRPATQPMAPEAVRKAMAAAGNELRSGTFYKVLGRLVDRGQVVATGSTGSRTYAVAASSGKQTEATKATNGAGASAPRPVPVTPPEVAKPTPIVNATNGAAVAAVPKPLVPSLPEAATPQKGAVPRPVPERPVSSPTTSVATPRKTVATPKLTIAAPLPRVTTLPPSRRGASRRSRRTHGEAIVEVLKKLGKPLLVAELKAAVAALPHSVDASPFATTLQRLRKTGKVASAWVSETMLYSLPAPRPTERPLPVPPIRRERPGSVVKAGAGGSR